MRSSTSAVPGKRERHFHISNGFARKTIVCRSQYIPLELTEDRARSTVTW